MLLWLCMRREQERLIGNAKYAIGIAWACLVGLMITSVLVYRPDLFSTKSSSPIDSATTKMWTAPDTSEFENHPNGAQLRYGRNLIAHTSKYLGPNGAVAQISNGMNCQNCHLYAGTKPYGNNFGSVASLYPRFRERSGTKESIEKRVNDCLQRSLNGQPLDSLSKEMRSIVAYLTWVGSNVPKGTKAPGSGLWKISILNRAADSIRGKHVYEESCRICHGNQGEGLMRFNKKEYVFPPLWGDYSFNTAAGLYRISNLANYVYANMPMGASYKQPQLTEEQAWDVAAYIVSKQRPVKMFVQDWPNVNTKPFDHPFGPYADTLSEATHKYGPFQEILQLRKEK